jgi:hypothetical protein
MHGVAKVQVCIAGFAHVVRVHIKADAMHFAKPTHEVGINSIASSVEAAKHDMHVLADS